MKKDKGIKTSIDRNRYGARSTASIIHQAGVTCMDEEMVEEGGRRGE